MSLESTNKDNSDFEIHKKVIDADFSRFIRLEKAWIMNISHNILPTEKGYIHEDRKKLRKKLLFYLKQKIKGHSIKEEE